MDQIDYIIATENGMDDFTMIEFNLSTTSDIFNA